MDTPYFRPAAFTFLRQLATHNDRAWFAVNKARYEALVRDPFLRLIGDLAAPLARISPEFRADPRPQGGSLFRIYRDTRFANDKTPYKTSSGARFAHVRYREIEAPSFYLHLEPRRCFAGGGIWHPSTPTLAKIRDFIVDNPDAWKKAAHGTAFARRFAFHGDRLTRPPRGFDAAHPLIEDLKRKDFAAGAGFAEALACSAEFRPFIVDTFGRIAPLIDYLCAAVELEF